MFFVERDHMIEDFAATRSHPSFGNSVLPRCLHARLLGLQTRRLQKADHIGVVSRIAIEDGVTIRTSLGEGFTQLLHHPLGCRVSRHIEVQDRPASMLDDEETMQQSERHRWYGEEVESNDHLAMILQEGQPALTGIPAAMDSPQVASHGSLADDETQFQEFSVNLGCTPSCILFRHLANQGSNLLGDLRPAATWPRSPTPIQPETSPMPADDGRGFDNLEDIHPAGPATRQGSPEEPVRGEFIKSHGNRCLVQPATVLLPAIRGQSLSAIQVRQNPAGGLLPLHASGATGNNSGTLAASPPGLRLSRILFDPGTLFLEFQPAAQQRDVESRMGASTDA